MYCSPSASHHAARHRYGPAICFPRPRETTSLRQQQFRHHQQVTPVKAQLYPEDEGNSKSNYNNPTSASPPPPSGNASMYANTKAPNHRLYKNRPKKPRRYKVCVLHPKRDSHTWLTTPQPTSLPNVCDPRPLLVPALNLTAVRRTPRRVKLLPTPLPTATALLNATLAPGITRIARVPLAASKV